MSFACDEHKETVANIFQRKTPVTWPKIDIEFFLFLGVICHFSINIRIEVHCLFALGNESRLVACKSLRIAQQNLYVTSVLSFPIARFRLVDYE